MRDRRPMRRDGVSRELSTPVGCANTASPAGPSGRAPVASRSLVADARLFRSARDACATLITAESAEFVP